MQASCPNAGAVIFDEAHELEDVAGSYFGVSVSNVRIRRTVPRRRSLAAAQPDAIGRRCRARMQERARAGAVLLRAVAPGDGRFAFENRREFMEENGDEFLGLQQALTASGLGTGEPARTSRRKSSTSARRAQEMQVQLGFLMESEDRNTVFWIERRRGGREQAECFSAGHAHRRGSHL